MKSISPTVHVYLATTVGLFILSNFRLGFMSKGDMIKPLHGHLPVRLHQRCVPLLKSPLVLSSVSFIHTARVKPSTRATTTNLTAYVQTVALTPQSTFHLDAGALFERVCVPCVYTCVVVSNCVCLRAMLRASERSSINDAIVSHPSNRY